MINPIIPFGIKGALWYQGESNAGQAILYRRLFATMIKDWRARWGEGDFPFFFVQLANFMKVQERPSEGGWAEIRESQMLTLALPHTGMAVINDIGDADNIHPKNKQEVGRRLALIALATEYGQPGEYSGPLYDSMTVDGNKIRLKFTHVGGGLVVKGDKLGGFAIAGADKKFVWADAQIDGDTVVVSSDQVPAPVAVHYAWANNPVVSLYNKEGLPASSFRSDVPPGP
jgi:sialate O-acetylesterase